MGGRRFNLDYKGKILILFFASLFYVNEAGNAKFLGSQKRFNDSQMYDSYYCCNICGSTLAWVVNRKVVVIHFTSESRIGSVRHNQDTNTTLSYNSMILSRRDNTNETCMDAVLIASQTSPNWRPSVICRGTTDQHTIDYDDFTTNTSLPEAVYNNSVVAKPSIVQQDIVSPGNNFTTGMVMCRSNDGTVSWKGNGSFLVSFNGGTRPGSFKAHTHPLDPTVALWEAIVIDKNAQDITSVIVGTDSSPDNFNVSCHSLSHEASFVINSEKTRIPLLTTVAYAGSKQLTSYFFVMILMGLAAIFTLP